MLLHDIIPGYVNLQSIVNMQSIVNLQSIVISIVQVWIFGGTNIWWTYGHAEV